MKIPNIELTLEVNNLKQIVSMMQTAITAKCIDCHSAIAEKYLNMEQFCRRCPLLKYKEKEIPVEDNLIKTYAEKVNDFVTSRKSPVSL